ncbi:MAG TPA: flavodoxin family protein [Chloroflexi bacterium]|nr:flavodoxin family protein [Chloroflexota bacterium]
MGDGKIRVLGIAGSPRRRGNTETLLDRFLAGAKSVGAEVEKVVVARLRIAGCRACDGCWEDGRCVVQDDFQQLCEQIVDADVVALAAPLYFWNLPAQVKAAIDRSQCQWARKFIVKIPLRPTLSGRPRRRGVFISAGGEAEPYFDGAVRTVKGFFGVYEADYWGELLVGGVDAKGDVLRNPHVLEEAFDLGTRAATWDDTTIGK